MAVSIVNTTEGTDTDGTSTATTASVTPSANKLQLLSVTARTGDSTDTGTPTITGNGLTWVNIAHIVYDRTSASRKALDLFRAMGASPSTGAITIDYGSQTPSAISWALDEVSGMDTTGTNGSGAIVQSATNWHQDTDGLNTITVTLGAFSDSNNATFGAMAADGNTPATLSSVGTGFTQVGNSVNTGGDGVNLVREFRSDNDTTVDITWSKIVDLGGIAIEIKVAGAATPSQSIPSNYGMMGFTYS